MVAEFFEREAGELARACHAMASAFARGGTLIPFGTGAAASDAAHAAVEFMHPVIVGKRALPALAPSNDVDGGHDALADRRTRRHRPRHLPRRCRSADRCVSWKRLGPGAC